MRRHLHRTIAEMNADWLVLLANDLATYLFMFTTDMCSDMCSQPEMSGLRDSGIVVPARNIGITGSNG